MLCKRKIKLFLVECPRPSFLVIQPWNIALVMQDFENLVASNCVYTQILTIKKNENYDPRVSMKVRR